MGLFGISFSERIIVYISSNFMEACNIETDKVAHGVPRESFTTNRLLIGNFEAAAELSRQLVSQVRTSRILKPILKVVVQPLELIEGGLSYIERKAFRDLGLQTGAKEVYLVDARRTKISKSEALQFFENGGV